MNRLLQKFYEKADEICTRYASSTWVVCESLKIYKKKLFNTDSIYIPNSSIFNKRIYEMGKDYKTGDKLAWTGSLLTERQFEILFSLLKTIQEKIRPDLKIYLAPTHDIDKFKDFANKYNLINCHVLQLNSRSEWQEVSAKFDVGIAVYDEKFGSTEFIEPLKIWDFMMGGLPFIISCEPSISKLIKKSGIAYFLKHGNKIPDDNTLKEFLQTNNINHLSKKCIEIAREYDISKQIEKALKKFQEDNKKK